MCEEREEVIRVGGSSLGTCTGAEFVSESPPREWWLECSGVSRSLVITLTSSSGALWTGIRHFIYKSISESVDRSWFYR